MFTERLTRLRQNIGMNKKQLAQKLCLPYTTYNNYEMGLREPNSETLVKLATYFNVTTDYLLGKTNDTYNKKVKYHDIINKYDALDEHGKKIIDLILEEEYSRTLQQQVQEEYEDNDTPIKIHFLPVSAGSGTILDSDEYEIMRVPSTPTVLKTDFAVRVSGDSMEPKYFDGDILLVQETPSIDDDEYGIFTLNGEGFFKKKIKNKLISLNAKYPPKTINEYDDVKICGKVIGKL